MKILVTGNPNYGIAQSINENFYGHELAFYSRNYNDFDLNNPEKIAELAEVSTQYDVFINNARLGAYNQVKLYEEVYRIWTLVKKQGLIINLGSTADIARDANYTYASEKAALKKASEGGSFANNFKNSGIKVTYISFGWVATPVLKRELPNVKKHSPNEIALLLKWIVEYPMPSSCINEIRLEPIQ
jgi:short-subunit dehydrogenase